jgi:hypothetical protein
MNRARPYVLLLIFLGLFASKGAAEDFSLQQCMGTGTSAGRMGAPPRQSSPRHGNPDQARYARCLQKERAFQERRQAREQADKQREQQRAEVQASRRLALTGRHSTSPHTRRADAARMPVESKEPRQRRDPAARQAETQASRRLDRTRLGAEAPRPAAENASPEPCAAPSDSAPPCPAE